MFLTVVSCGCSYRMAKGEFNRGFSYSMELDGRYSVRYSGKSMGSSKELERLLRKGVTDLCGTDDFSLVELRVGTEDVMERWESPYRFVEGTAVCSRQHN